MELSSTEADSSASRGRSRSSSISSSNKWRGFPSVFLLCTIMYRWGFALTLLGAGISRMSLEDVLLTPIGLNLLSYSCAFVPSHSVHTCSLINRS